MQRVEDRRLQTLTPRSSIVATRKFGKGDQESFAALSGDYNPMHMDAVAARRTQAGAPVVHGVHALLWALDRLAADGAPMHDAAALTVNFAKFIYLDRDLTLNADRDGETTLRAELVADGLATTTISLMSGARPVAANVPSSAGWPLVTPDRPIERDVSEISGLYGRMALAASEPIARKFPALAAAWGAPRIAGIMQLSTLVGMVCPGLHSVFADLSLELTEPSPAQISLDFRVASADARFRSVEVEVGGPGFRGKVKAFVRRPPVAQAGVAEIARQVAPGEFAGSIALVIGGSRGIGAVTAKILGAGGAGVVLTYATGHDDAAAVAEEISRHAGREACSVRAFDVHGDIAAQLDALSGRVTHLYYFASPPIYRQKTSEYHAEIFAEFVRVYVDGFHQACSAVAGTDKTAPLTAFYPSTIFLDKPPLGFTEYCMAKAAGEQLCAEMTRSAMNVRVVVNRLPRLMTDQTSGFFAARNADPLTVMLPVVRAVQAPTG